MHLLFIDSVYYRSFLDNKLSSERVWDNNTFYFYLFLIVFVAFIGWQAESKRRRTGVLPNVKFSFIVVAVLLSFILGFRDTMVGMDTGGYKEYFHVDTYYKRPRGITLLGKGFSINSKGNHINIDDAHFLRWTDINLPIEITPEEYIDTFEDYINTVKLNLIKFREHRPEQDEFKFKKDLEEGRIKIKWEGLNN